MQYPLLGFSMPSAIHPVEYLTSFSHKPADTQRPSRVTDSHSPGVSARKLSNATSRQAIKNRAEILGEDGVLEELAKKQGSGKKKRKGRGSGKGKRESKDDDSDESEAGRGMQGSEETETGEPESENGAQRALHDLTHAVKAPFGGNKEKEDAVLNDIQHADRDSPVDNSYTALDQMDLVAEKAADDDDDDDETCKQTNCARSSGRSTFSNKSTEAEFDEDKDDDDSSEDTLKEIKSTKHTKGKSASLL